MTNVNDGSYNAIQVQGKKLARRQSECLYYLIRGMTIKQIAMTLGLSPRTVENYIKNLKKKLHCYSRASLISYALDNHFPIASLHQSLNPLGKRNTNKKNPSWAKN